MTGKLKELRSRYGFTQKQLAEKLGTTQQTIGRWETGQVEIPTSQLKDMAALFGVSVDQLLGVEHRLRSNEFARARHKTPFGTLTAVFAFGSRDYPIDEEERDRLAKALHVLGLEEGQKSWIEFGALDNRLVYLNPAFLRGIKLTSDHTEAMPFFASPETYRGLSDFSEDDEVGPTIAVERERLIQLMAPNETIREQALLEVQSQLSCIKLIYSDGTEEATYLSDEIATSIYKLSVNLEVGSNAFLAIEEDGEELHLVNLSHVAAIEAPLEAYLEHLSKDVVLSDND